MTLRNKEQPASRFIPLDREAFRQIGVFLFWTLVFAVAFTQWPLYSENQNTKFLQGLAHSGYGLLGEDWLANTVDPLPLFSFLVQITNSLLPEYVFHLYHGLLLGVYLFSVLNIVTHAFPALKDQAGRLLFLVALIAMHAGLLPPFSTELMGTSLGWLLQAGVANQYLFNPVFQPSTFGILLVLSIDLFLRGKPRWAAFSAALAAAFHSTYLPAAAALAGTYALLDLLAKRKAGRTWAVSLRSGLSVGLLALAVVSPVLIYNVLAFQPTSAEAWQRSQDIIVHFRIPHHSIPAIWFNDTVYLKVALVLVALILVRKSRLLPIFWLSFVVAVLGTAAQVLTGNDTLAFIAPWRISVFLVPLSSALLMAGLAVRLGRWLQGPLARLRPIVMALSLAALLLLSARGIQAMRDSTVARRDSDRAPLLAFVQASKAPGQTYLTPTYLAEFCISQEHFAQRLSGLHKPNTVGEFIG